jgi:hypothetical protein
MRAYLLRFRSICAVLVSIGERPSISEVKCTIGHDYEVESGLLNSVENTREEWIRSKLDKHDGVQKQSGVMENGMNSMKRNVAKSSMISPREAKTC